MQILSLESILYQGKSNPLVNAINYHFDKVIQAKARNDYSALKDNLNMIGTVVTNRTGIRLDVILEDTSTFNKIFGNPYSMSISLPTENAHLNILNPKATKLFTSGNIDSFKVLDIVNGTMDYNEVKVSGFYSDIIFELKLYDMLLDGKVEAEHLTSVVMHELGHIWTILATIGVGVITSAMAAGVVDFFGRYDNPAVRAKFGKMVSKSVGSNVDVVDEKDLITTVLASTETTFTKLTSLKYKSTATNELLADQFASRWGTGASLVEALRRIYDANTWLGRVGMTGKWRGVLGTIQTISTSPWIHFFMDHRIQGKLVTSVISRGAMTASAVATSIVITTVLGSFIAEVLVDLFLPNGTHPDIKQRIEFIRRDQVALLRTNLSKKDRALILKDIDSIDKVYKDVQWWGNHYRDNLRSLVRKLWGTTQDIDYKDSLSLRDNNPLHELKARLDQLK